MAEPKTLTIRLHPRGVGMYGARLSVEGAEADSGSEDTITFVPAALNAAAADPDRYGLLLGGALLRGAPRVRDAWAAARADADAANAALRVRLALSPDDEPTRRARWEALGDPGGGAAVPRLFTDQRVWFSRWLDSADTRPVRVREKAAVRALVAVAVPTDLDGAALGDRTFRQADWFDPAAEAEAVARLLAPLEVVRFPAAGGPPATAARVLDALRGGHERRGFDLLYLVAHGGMVGGAPKLLMPMEDGTGELVDGRQFAQEVGKLWDRPVLVVLASCQSAGSPGGMPTAAAPPAPDDADPTLAAEFGRAGVPAVLAMHGNIFQDTARAFLAAFLANLMSDRVDGVIDWAVCEARHAVAAQSQFWSPVLASRLTRNRLWRPRAADAGFHGWASLIRQLKKGRCVPVLGAGLLAPLVGSTRELAYQWAARSADRIPSRHRADVPQLAQYLISKGDPPSQVREEYGEVLAAQLRDGWPELEPAAAAADGAARPPGGVGSEPDPATGKTLAWLTAAARRRAETSEVEPNALLARLPCPIYITTNPDDALTSALRGTPQGKILHPPAPPADPAAPRDPRPEVCNWLTPAPAAAPAGRVRDRDAARQPSWQAPVVYHLCGHLGAPASLVLTEDDYFRFVVEMAFWNESAGVSRVKSKIATSGLLFLGFKLDDWNFRMFFQVFMRARVAENVDAFDVVDVAVQIDPDDEDEPDADEARAYIAQLFRGAGVRANVNVYFGGLDQFLRELLTKYRQP